MRFSKLLFLLLVLFLISISVYAQNDILSYEQVAEYEVGVVRDLIMLNDDYLVASDSGIWAFNHRELEFRQQEPPAAVSRIVYYNDFEVVLIYEDNSMGIWDTANGVELSHYSGHSGAINDVIVLGSGAFLVSGSDDGTVRLWDIATGTETLIFESETPITELAYHSIIGVLASLTEDNRVHLWGYPQREELGILDFDSEISAIGFNTLADEMLIGTADGKIHVWHLVTQASFEYEGVIYPLYQVPLESGTQNLALVNRGRSSSDFIDPTNPSAGLINWAGSWRTLNAVLPSVEESSETLVLDVHTAAVRALPPHYRLMVSISDDNSIRGWIADLEFYHLEFASDVEIILMNDYSNSLFATVHEDNSVLIWSTEYGILYAQLPPQGAKTTFVASRPFNSMATVTDDGILHIWR